MTIDAVRLKLIKLVKDHRSDLKNVSLAIGRNAAYLHQFVHRGTPKVLPEDVRAALAAHLGCDEDELRHTKRPPRKPRTRPQTDLSPAASPPPLQTGNVTAGEGMGAPEG